jgi:hypothetical protein
VKGLVSAAGRALFDETGTAINHYFKHSIFVYVPPTASGGLWAAVVPPEESAPVAVGEPVKAATESGAEAEPVKAARVPETDSEPAAAVWVAEAEDRRPTP